MSSSNVFFLVVVFAIAVCWRLTRKEILQLFSEIRHTKKKNVGSDERIWPLVPIIETKT